MGVRIKKKDVNILPIFDILQKTGKVSEKDMFNTFNMGVGMSVTLGKDDVSKAIEILKNEGENAYVLGEIVKSEDGVILE